MIILSTLTSKFPVTRVTVTSNVTIGAGILIRLTFALLPPAERVWHLTAEEWPPLSQQEAY